MRRLNLIILLVLIILFTNSYTVYVPVYEMYGDAAEASDLSIAFQQPVHPIVARVPDVSEFDPKDIQLYIKEQCYTIGINYHFAISLLREENPAFFRLFDEIVPQEWVFEVLNRNDNGSTDYGLWQLNGNFLWVNFLPSYWHDLCEFDWKNPYHNTYVAVRHIKWLYTSLQRHHSEKGNPQPVNTIYWETAMAYNAGLDRIRSGMMPANKTLDYAARVVERVYL